MDTVFVVQTLVHPRMAPLVLYQQSIFMRRLQTMCRLVAAHSVACPRPLLRGETSLLVHRGSAILAGFIPQSAVTIICTR